MAAERTTENPAIVEAAPAAEPRRSRRRGWYRTALGATAFVVLAILAMLPFAISSMRDVLGRGPDPEYDMLSGQELAGSAAAPANASYFNFGLVDLDETTGLVTVAVSGNRACPAACPSLTITLAALDDNADERRGLPPSATVTLGANDRIFSQSVQLPVRGQPSLYPFDDYVLWLGLAAAEPAPDGTPAPLDPATIANRVAVTLQNRISDMMMPPPEPIDPRAVRAATDPFPFIVVHALHLKRPAYLQVMAVALVSLVAVSAALALFTRGIDELILGIGGLVLGVWGVRSVLMPQALPTVTAIDLALSWLILLLLLGLAIRAALHFHRHSELPLPWRQGSHGDG